MQMNHQNGFTYLGLLILIAILGGVSGATTAVWHSVIQRENERELIFIGNQFRLAIERYARDHGGRLPLSLDDLIKDSKSTTTKRYLRKIYHDPITGGTDWGLVKGNNGGILGVHSLSDQHPIKSFGFRPADKDFVGKDKYSEWVFAYRGHQIQPEIKQDQGGIARPMPRASELNK